jgi:hypothetical protein
MVESNTTEETKLLGRTIRIQNKHFSWKKNRAEAATEERERHTEETMLKSLEENLL